MIEDFEIHPYFITGIATVHKPEFLIPLHPVVEESLATVTEEEKEFELFHTHDISQDERCQPFCQYVGKSAWSILQEQGYFMNNKTVLFESMWCQEYRKHTYMPQHVHGNGVQLVGFYFMNCPEDGCLVNLHDPRPGKLQASLDETNPNQLSYASNNIMVKPTPGMLIIKNSWVPHSFTQNRSDESFKFIHFNIAVTQAPQSDESLQNSATVI